MFPAFRSPAYLRLWTGSFISNTGMWMHQAASGWLVYGLTDSAFWLGATAFVAMSPSLVFSLYGGVIADRTNRRRLFIGTQIVLMASALALAALTASGLVTLGQLLLLSLVSGTAMAMATPVYQTILHELVPPAHLMNAISLNSVQFNLARIIGPIAMGLAAPLIGLGGCFAVNGISFLALIASVATLEIAVHGSSGSHSLWSDLRAGLSYAWRTRRIRTPLTLAASLSLFGFPYMILLPAYARDVLHLDAGGYGYLAAMPGAGAVVGGLGLAAFGNVRHKGVLAALAAVFFSLNLIGFALSTRPWIAAAFLFFAGLSMVNAVSTVNTLLQLTVEAGMRGRVMSMLSFALFGLSPIGGLHLGTWAHYVGTPRALAGGGVACLLLALCLLAFAPELRRPAPLSVPASP
jgi:MFS family permease